MPGMQKKYPKRSSLQKFGSLTIAVLFAICVGSAFSQNAETRNKNNPYSPSPDPKNKQATASPTPGSSSSNEVAFVMQNSRSSGREVNRPQVDNRPSIAQATFKIAKEAEAKSAQPSELYKIGVGDVLLVNLKNSPQGSGYYTVRHDGTIDYPLAGDNVVVAQQTLEEIEDLITAGITLFSDPQLDVKIRQYASHKIIVSGMVENGGEKYLQREAMPLFAIRAEAGVSPRATRVAVTRNPQTETFDLRDPKTENVLIYPGSTLEFTTDTGSFATGSSYFIGGEIVSGGQKELTTGLTLYQAVIVSGGTKGDPKKAIVRRKNEKGMFTVLEHNIRSIKDGKAMDPFLAPGDVIEIKN